MTTPASPGNKHSPQNILNWSFDEDFKVLSVEQLGYNSSSSAVERISTTNGSPNIIEDFTGRNFSHITASAVTAVKTSSGILYDVIVNTPVTGAITLYNSLAASGTVIGVINSSSSINPFQETYNLPFSIGLTINTVGTADLTVTYK